MNLWKDHNWTPMLLKEIEKPFKDSNYLFELKFDGMRCTVFANKKKIKVLSRNGIDITELYPELKEIKNIVTKNTIFDGEIIALEDGLPSFSKLQTRNHLKDKRKILYQSSIDPVIFMCFDILYENKDLTNKTLLERKKILNHYRDSDIFNKVKFIEKEGILFFKEIKKYGLEGIIAKKKDSTYKINTRSDEWLKIKNLKIETFLIGGFIEKEKNAAISLVLGEMHNNHLYYVGKVSMSKKNKLYQKLKKENPIKNNPFEDYKEHAIFIKPIFVCQVKYLERTKNNHLRQPILDD